MNSVVNTANSFLTRIFDLILLPFGGFAGIWGLWFVSILSGIILVILYGKVSNQTALRRIKDRIYGALLESVIFRQHPSMALKAQARMFGLAFHYLFLAIPPIIILSVPCILIMAQLNLRFGYGSLAPGFSAIITAQAAGQPALNTISLHPGQGVAVETPPVRVPQDLRAYWRIRPASTAPQELQIETQNSVIIVPLRSEAAALSRPAVFTSSPWWSLLYPGSLTLPPESPVTEVTVSYPESEYRVFGFQTSWIVIFLALSILTGFVWSRIAGIEI